MRFRKFQEDESHVSITPLIDIVFLLLIFFMLTSHFHVASGIPIKLPKVAQKAYNQAEVRTVLVVDRVGRCYLKGERIGLKDLEPTLASMVNKNDLDSLIIQADKDVKHGLVVQIMDLAKKAGVITIIIAAKWEPEQVI
jgi:biopolymer transport protein ExbD